MRYIKSFVGSGVRDVVDEANEFAKSEKLEIVSSSLTFSGAGKLYETAVLIVVFDGEKPKRTRKKSGDKEVSADE